MQKQGMLAMAMAAMVLAGCQTQKPDLRDPYREDYAAEIKTVAPVKGGKACWVDDVTPLVIETVVEQKEVTPAKRDKAGNKTTKASFQSVSNEKIVQERRKIWFRAPCKAEMTPEFTASLQRALKARGLYLQSISGQMDKATRRAVRAFQSPRGLESEKLSLAAARELGLSLVELPPRPTK